MQARRALAILAAFLVAGVIGYLLVGKTNAHGNQGLDLRLVAQACLGLGLAILVCSGVRGQRALDQPAAEDPSRKG